MATGTNGIATVNDLVGGKGLRPPLDYTTNQCPPKEVIVNGMRGIVPSAYVSNQLVKYSDVVKAITIYTLRIITTTAYSSLALFTSTGGIPNPASVYYLMVTDSPKNYIMTFAQGSGIMVNDPASPSSPVTIYNGHLYKVGVRVSLGSPWTIIATLMHVDGNKTEYI